MPPGLRLSDISPKILVAVTQQWREAPEKQLGSKPQDSPLVAPTRGAGFSRKGPTNNSTTNNQNYTNYMTNHNTSQTQGSRTDPLKREPARSEVTRWRVTSAKRGPKPIRCLFLFELIRDRRCSSLGICSGRLCAPRMTLRPQILFFIQE